MTEERHNRDHYAYQRDLRLHMARMLERLYIDSHTPAKETVICEAVERSKSVIPQDEIKFLQNQLFNSAADYDIKMKKFRLVEDNDQPFTEREQTNAPQAPAPKRRRKTAPAPTSQP